MSGSSGLLPTVVETNPFVSGMIAERGNPYALLEAWRARSFRLLLSDEQHLELLDVFGRPRIVQRHGLTTRGLAELFDGLANATRVQPAPTLPVHVRDAKDEKILAAAIGGGADDLVTGDDDLLALRNDPRLAPLKIVTAAEFLGVLGKAERRS